MSTITRFPITQRRWSGAGHGYTDEPAPDCASLGKSILPKDLQADLARDLVGVVYGNLKHLHYESLFKRMEIDPHEYLRVMREFRLIDLRRKNEVIRAVISWMEDEGDEDNPCLIGYGHVTVRPDQADALIEEIHGQQRLERYLRALPAALRADDLDDATIQTKRQILLATQGLDDVSIEAKQSAIKQRLMAEHDVKEAPL